MTEINNCLKRKLKRKKSSLRDNWINKYKKKQIEKRIFKISKSKMIKWYQIKQHNIKKSKNCINWKMIEK